MPLEFNTKIESVDTIDYQEFQERFFIPQVPVKIKNLLAASNANKKWSPDFLKNKLGHINVGVFDNNPAFLDRSQKSATTSMKFSNYLEMIQEGPTDSRLHLFNIFKHKPELINDFEFPDIVDYILKPLPFAFIGGEGSVARLHRDMDNSNVFLTEFWGRKKVVLFAPEYDELLYKYPFATHSPVDVDNPDYERFPGLHFVEGSHTILEKGETLFMPAKYWHYIKYLSVGIGMSFRSLGSISNTASGVFQASVVSTIDDTARIMLGEDWHQIKSDWANRRAEKVIEQVGLLQS